LKRPSKTGKGSSGSAAGQFSATDKANLKKLGEWLSAKDVSGRSAGSRKSVAAQRQKDFTNEFYTKRGGGQGKSAPKASSYPSAPKKRPDVRGNAARARSNRTPTTR
jgi:hypothetical protein